MYERTKHSSSSWAYEPQKKQQKNKKKKKKKTTKNVLSDMRAQQKFRSTLRNRAVWSEILTVCILDTKNAYCLRMDSEDSD